MTTHLNDDDRAWAQGMVQEFEDDELGRNHATRGILVVKELTERDSGRRSAT